VCEGVAAAACAVVYEGAATAACGVKPVSGAAFVAATEVSVAARDVSVAARDVSVAVLDVFVATTGGSTATAAYSLKLAASAVLCSGKFSKVSAIVIFERKSSSKQTFENFYLLLLLLLHPLNHPPQLWTHMLACTEVELRGDTLLSVE